MASSGGRTGRNVYLAAIEPGSGKSGEVRRRLPGTVGDEPAYAMPEVAMLDAPTVAEVAHALSARFLRPRGGAAAASAHFGTMMVHAGLAGGMVSGAAHTTAHTTRPAFEVIRTTSGVSIMSSVFFMRLADRVLVYGDCEVVPNPNAEQLADIAISAAATAAMFGILTADGHVPKVCLWQLVVGHASQQRLERGEHDDRIDALAVHRVKDRLAWPLRSSNRRSFRVVAAVDRSGAR
jgi:hypothetical protein